MRTSAEVPSGTETAERHYGPGEPAFKGHFPKTKILPGVKLIEFALDTAEGHFRRGGPRRSLARMSGAKFLAPVFPGQTVRCECRFAGEGASVEMRATLSLGDTVCATVKASYREEN